MKVRMISKILIANRSEIACRIIKACRELQIKTVAIYSDADREALHVKLADEAIYIGNSKASESYLNMDNVINAAIKSGADAIHPGYGFLSENPTFNRKVREAGLIFIGPTPEQMELLGSKIQAKNTMKAAGVPVIEGMSFSSNNIDDYIEAAKKIGFPILLKASAGGGGKGMRIVKNIGELQSSVEAAKRESLAAFSSDEVFMEKYIEEPRHIEFQVVADKYSNVVHLFERECSIQRRHQKIIEESPSVALNDALRNEMGISAIKALQAVNYESVATVEFLLDKSTNYYFLEVNTRIQVEHPITEMVTGVDLVKLQIEIANGKAIPFKQDEIKQNGHSIECRIYAEDGDNNFLPSSGKIIKHHIPSGFGIRYDSGIYEGFEVSTFYDPILAKLIVWGRNREEALTRTKLALDEHILLGLNSSTGFIKRVLNHKDFIEGKTTTNFIDLNLESLNNKNENLIDFVLAAIHSEEANSFVEINGNESKNTWLYLKNWEIGGKGEVL